MSNIIERLRDKKTPYSDYAVIIEAAVEIERLTAERDALRNKVYDLYKENDMLKAALCKIEYDAQCDWCADIARRALAEHVDRDQ